MDWGELLQDTLISGGQGALVGAPGGPGAALVGAGVGVGSSLLENLFGDDSSKMSEADKFKAAIAAVQSIWLEILMRQTSQVDAENWARRVMVEGTASLRSTLLNSPEFKNHLSGVDGVVLQQHAQNVLARMQSSGSTPSSPGMNPSPGVPSVEFRPNMLFYGIIIFVLYVIFRR